MAMSPDGTIKIPTFHVNSFTGKGLRGNPSVVCLLETWMDDRTLQHIAYQNNVSETAFLVGRHEKWDRENTYELRCFTPTVEVDLCGHATLASGVVICSYVNTDCAHVCFKTMSEIDQWSAEKWSDVSSLRFTKPNVFVEKRGDLFSIDFPARPPAQAAPSAVLTEGLGMAPNEVFQSRDLLAVFNDEAQIQNMTPDVRVLAQMRDVFGIIVTAPGMTVDFVSRFFSPNAGIPEDPVTGSAHCTLVPYWAARLGKDTLHAQQLSARGGELFCEHNGKRVTIAGRAVVKQQGETSLLVTPVGALQIGYTKDYI
tara:strand:- start:521 stop:1456 length:936 start_codon:yes stop_codon:yes gene_type:complete